MPLINLSPAGLHLDVARGTRLQDVLFAQGVEFPCGGRGCCKGCRVKVLKGHLPIGAEEKNLLSPTELENGWRLACQHSVSADLELGLAQWKAAILSDQTSFAFVPREGHGIAIDLGSTTIVAQLIDLTTGNVLGVQTALNAQARYGGDIMSRVQYAMDGGHMELQRLVREQLGSIVAKLLVASPARQTLHRVVIVGNTIMHHLFCGVNIAPMATHPFQPEQPGRFKFSPGELGWDLSDQTVVEFLPCLGGFVGSDILAGIVATGLHESSVPMALIDLGTNGEIVIGNREKILCTSTAAGPAFEGARISQGMRAVTGAISGVTAGNGCVSCRVLGDGAARGLCGSGLVDAVAAGLELKWIQPNGRMSIQPRMKLTDQVFLQPGDVRELQLAKGAIAAGLKILAKHFGITIDQLQQVHLAGAFGNYISRASAQKIGLLRVPQNRVVPAGNTALLGAKRALFDDDASWDAIARHIEHVSLNEDMEFQNIYAEEMRFPEAS